MRSDTPFIGSTKRPRVTASGAREPITGRFETAGSGSGGGEIGRVPFGERPVEVPAIKGAGRPPREPVRPANFASCEHRSSHVECAAISLVLEHRSAIQMMAHHRLSCGEFT